MKQPRCLLEDEFGVAETIESSALDGPVMCVGPVVRPRNSERLKGQQLSSPHRRQSRQRVPPQLRLAQVTLPRICILILSSTFLSSWARHLCSPSSSPTPSSFAPCSNTKSGTNQNVTLHKYPSILPRDGTALLCAGVGSSSIRPAGVFRGSSRNWRVIWQGW